jgi:hypothetical protein
MFQTIFTCLKVQEKEKRRWGRNGYRTTGGKERVKRKEKKDRKRGDTRMQLHMLN